ncbi:hypothetical protein [Cobetia sp. UCD-24C]|uniref:hypothetical protein n=1 Tax=Cobetia sp. UCD-24C TaxID=1716176 RepID=UPI00139660FC|nr:hypothetical protein [Cobetia sp. UCD-24C]
MSLALLVSFQKPPTGGFLVLVSHVSLHEVFHVVHFQVIHFQVIQFKVIHFQAIHT